METGKTETQLYKVITKENNFEIRFYPSTTMAAITSSAKTYKELGNLGFNKLAGYILGGNAEKKQISTTTPVHMDINDTVSSMSFVMPAEYDVNNLPIPNNADVTLKIVPAEYVAAITFSGFASDEAIAKHTTLLKNALQKTHLEYKYHNFNSKPKKHQKHTTDRQVQSGQGRTHRKACSQKRGRASGACIHIFFVICFSF